MAVQTEPTTSNAADSLAERIDALDYVAATVRLPDFHLKEGMEAPASFVVASRGVIVPHLVSESINDGMGLIRTGIAAGDLSPEALRSVAVALNLSGARTKLTSTPYSWTPSLLEAACREGAAPLIAHYRLDPQTLDAVEDGGRAAGPPLSAARYHAAVPLGLRRSRLSRSEIGLNFGGNHFLEIQAVDRIVDPAHAARLGISDGELVVMYHLGPGPLGSILSNLFAYRIKPPPHRKLGYAVLRNLLHASRGAEHFRTFAAFSHWLAVDEDSEAGRALAEILAIVKNYGFAYRMATVAAIRDALVSSLGVDRSQVQLVVDLSHNMLQPETIDGEALWVSRANCCRPAEGRPGIVAGSHQVPSCLTVGPPGCERVVAGFDHGVGYLLEQATAAGALDPDPRHLQVQRIKMVRGTPEVCSETTLPLLTSTVLDDAIVTLAASGFAQPVAYLRPVANLKHRVGR